MCVCIYLIVNESHFHLCALKFKVITLHAYGLLFNLKTDLYRLQINKVTGHD